MMTLSDEMLDVVQLGSAITPAIAAATTITTTETRLMKPIAT